MLTGRCRILLINSGAQYRWLEGGQRLHLQHGPIDLVISAQGERRSVARAYQYAHEAFKTVLDDLVAELVSLKQVLPSASTEPLCSVAKRMVCAASQCTELDTVTPMIAVAGSVADHVLDAMLKAPALDRVYVNNGGDIALWIAADQTFTVGICDNVETGTIAANLTLEARHLVRGIATSGWRGRSHSLGIADAVTVLASCAADADAAATVIANAVDVPGSRGVHRVPAVELSPDSDLGSRLVTVAVDALTTAEIELALQRGRSKAYELLSRQAISAAYISLAGTNIVCDQKTNKLCAGAMHA